MMNDENNSPFLMLQKHCFATSVFALKTVFRKTISGNTDQVASKVLGKKSITNNSKIHCGKTG